MMKRNPKTQARRYYLQNCLVEPLSVNGTTHIITGPYVDFKSIPVGQRYYVGQLIEMGYNYQLDLFKQAEYANRLCELPPELAGDQVTDIKASSELL
jgi:hypothetical protein